MEPIELIIGNYIDEVFCESFIDPETNRIRVRPLPNQGIPITLVIECRMEERKRYPIGTIFRTENVRVCVKDVGRIYLRAKDQMIYKI